MNPYRPPDDPAPLRPGAPEPVHWIERIGQVILAVIVVAAVVLFIRRCAAGKIP